MRLPIPDITIAPDRQRRELGDITELADSIKRLGLINPIVVTAENRLVAGERRLRAMISLGWTSLAAHQYRHINELSPWQLEAIELEENIKRKDVTWQEQVAAVTRYHTMRTSQVSDWTITQTAGELGLSVSFVSQMLVVANEAEKKPELLQEQKFSVARNLAARTRERVAAAAVENILGGDPEYNNPAAPKPDVPLINADFCEWLTSYIGPPFNFIHCDFPYGIDFDKQNGQNSSNKERYRDDKGYYIELLNAFRNLPVAGDAHLMFWFSMSHYALTRTKLAEAGWQVQEFPLIWGKSDNSGILPDPRRGPRRNYETAFIASRGDRPIVQAVSNIWWGSRGAAEHASVKPQPMLEHFFRMFVDETSQVLDPTCGSGNALKAASKLGAKRVLGIEQNETFWKDAVRNWKPAVEIEL